MTDKVVEQVVETAVENTDAIEEVIEAAAESNKVVYIVAGVAIIGVCGYFVYKKFAKKKACGKFDPMNIKCATTEEPEIAKNEEAAE